MNYSVGEKRSALTPVVAKQAIGSQEMQINTMEAIKADPNQVQNLTVPIKKSRTQGSGEKVLRDMPINKAQEMEVAPETIEQFGPTTSENEVQSAEVPEQISKSEQVPLNISPKKDNK